ncbi:MAG: glycosyltransferase family 4 protein [Verrucomicrobiota bacterium]
MKILVLTNLFPPHHAGTFDFRCESVSEALKQRGHEVRVLTSNYGLHTEQRDAEIERRLLLNGHFDQPLKTGWREVRKLEAWNHQIVRETVADFQPALIHVWSLQGLSKSLIFTLRHSRLPTVYDVADDWLCAGLREDPWLRWWNREKAPYFSGLWRRCLELAGQRDKLDVVAPTRMMKGYDRVPAVFGPPEAQDNVQPNSIGAFPFDRLYFCSQALKAKTEQAGFRVGHAEVFYPGIRTDLFFGEVKPMKASVKKFLIVTRLRKESGVMTALEALRLARDHTVQISLNIYGRGESDYMAQLRSFVVQHQLPVEFLTVSNQTRDLAAVYRQHDAFLHTSEWDEPFAATPLEAMACGLPVVGTRSGGARELLRHGENALTYRPGDCLELASRMQELQMQPALRCQMAETAQMEVITKFNESAVVDQIENYLGTSLEIWQRQ